MNFRQACQNMISQQLRTEGILDPYLLDLIATIPREHFVPEYYKDLAFADFAIPLGHQQYMLEPLTEARMIKALKLQPNEVILEVGTGSGYNTALFANLCKFVYSVDIIAEFTLEAQRKLLEANIENFQLITEDAALGWEDQAPYDAIAVTGSLPILPSSYRQLLKPGGRMFAILGTAPAMEATLISRDAEGNWHQEKLFETCVTPLINAPTAPSFKF